ncbi:MAG: phosphatidylserine/phosphatidylglycerophosphate/cardiolipin synthase family protein [Nitrososphaerota archaeon]|nr:phosphatidylserine/phosphatidylglycerophosphate/cardiolipin synthase family protein [Nitrososphaerota archaeon]
MPTFTQVVKERVISNRETPLPPSWIPRRRSELHANKRNNGAGGIWSAGDSDVLIARINEYVKSARNMICISSFLLDESEVVEELIRASHDVRIYIITASENILEKEPRRDSEFELERLNEHKRVLNRLAGITLIRTADSFHSKFIITDPSSDDAKGMLLTANITKDALVRNPEIGVELTPQETKDLFKQFTIGFWIESNRELLEPGKLSSVRRVQLTNATPPIVLPCTLQNLCSIKEALLDIIGEARHEIWVSIYGIDSDHEVSKKLISALSRGTKVKILTRIRGTDKHTKSLISLAQSGAEIVGHRYLHAKAIVVDAENGCKSIVMTANIDKKGLDEGFETGVILNGSRAMEVKMILQKWWEEFNYGFSIAAKVGEVIGDVIIPNNGSLKKLTVKEKGENNIGEIVAKSIERIDEAADRVLATDGRSVIGNTIYHEEVRRCTVIPSEQ